MAEPTIPSTPTPQIVEIIAAIIRILLMILGALGFHYSVDVTALSGAIAVIIGVTWTVYEQFRQAQLRHATAVASARGGKAVTYKSYTTGGSQ